MTPHSLGAGTTTDFIAREYDTFDLKDKRLENRAKGILSVLQRKLGSCIRRLFDTAAQARQAYDFFSNPNVTHERLIAPHYEQTVKRIHTSDAK